MAIRDSSSSSSSNGVSNGSIHRRFALIIANSKYDDLDLQNLAAPGQDADAFSEVLKNVDIGSFEVKILKNEPSYKVTEEIETFFNDRYRDDLLLLYFSCHGIKDVDGRLYYATINTRRKLLASTGVSANFVNDVMLRSRSRRQMLMIDCCYGGAFARGMLHKSDKVVHTGEQFEGRGRIVLTASDAMQYSFEGDRREGVGQSSVFTHAIVKGLETGEADIDKNGLVSYTELYNYAFDRVIDETPMQKPGMWVFGLEGDVVVAKNPYKTKVEVRSPDEQDPNDLILDSEENLKRGNYTDTIEYTDKAIKINPRFAVAYNIKGQALFNLKRYNEALLCYEKALQLRPKYIAAINNKGLALAAMSEYDKAIGCFNQSSDLNPNDSNIWNHKGLALHTLGKYDDAIGSFDKAISLNPTYTEASNNKELSLSQLKKKKQQQEQGFTKPAVPLTTSKKVTEFADKTVPRTAISPETYSQKASSGPSVPTQTAIDKGQQKKPLSFISPKVLIAIIGVIAVIGAAIAFTFFGPTNQAPNVDQEPSTQAPSSITPSIPADTTEQTVPVSNHHPIANNQTVTTEVNKPVDIALTAFDPDINNNLTARIVSPPLNGRVGEIDQDTGVVTYTPNPGFTGTDSFTFNANDGKVDSNKTGNVGIAINQLPVKSPNNPPIANNQSVETTMNKVIDTTLTASDPDKDDNLTAAIVSKPLHGTLSDIDQNTGVVTYTPNPGFTGTDSFTFKANDGKVDSNNVGRISITVNNAQD